jgi:hypothetical protein
MSSIDFAGQFLGKLFGAAKGLALYGIGDEQRSLSDIGKLTSVEPLVIVSPDCMNLEYMPQINQSLLSIFTAYYLQAVDVLSAVKDASTVRVLEQLNPNRSGFGTIMSFESYKSSFDYNLLPSNGLSLHFEKAKTDFDEDGSGGPKSFTSGSHSQTGDSKSSIQEAVNLSVGRLMDVTIESNKANGDTVKATLKMNFRLIVNQAPESVITGILSNGTLDRNFMERFHAWRSGRLGFIRDLILCQDIIDEKYKTAVQDKSGVGTELFQRIAANKTFGFLTQNPSLANSSNMFVISEEVARQVEAKAGGKMTDFRVRQKIFEQSYAMIIVVVNRETSRMKFFVRNQPDYSNMSRKEIEGYSKGGKGPDVMEIFRSLQTASFSNF